ncbi:hypothetical protein MAB47J26_02980 [Mycobacteroides abscessus 47J26]|nr:hypothetical protein MAB47J26_02980 [Mycobacteroides abscessus 47J26]
MDGMPDTRRATRRRNTDMRRSSQVPQLIWKTIGRTQFDIQLSAVVPQRFMRA